MKSYKIGPLAGEMLRRAVQEHAISLGFVWRNGATGPRHIGVAKYLYLHSCGDRKVMTYGTINTFYLNSTNDQLTLDEFFNLRPEDVQEEPTHTIAIDGKVITIDDETFNNVKQYFKDILKALEEDDE